MSVLGFCALLQSPRRPSAVLNNARHFVPAILVQLKELVQSYQGDVVHIVSLCMCTKWTLVHAPHIQIINRP